MEDLEKFENNSANAGQLAKTFYSFIKLMSCKVNRFNIEREYK